MFVFRKNEHLIINNCSKVKKNSNIIFPRNLINFSLADHFSRKYRFKVSLQQKQT